jgi:hypothetical protein
VANKYESPNAYNMRDIPQIKGSQDLEQKLDVLRPGAFELEAIGVVT